VSATDWAIAALSGLLLLTSCERSERADREAPGPGALAGIEAHLAAREYHASENGQGLQAPNRAHNLRTYFDATGIRVHDRTAAGSPQLLQLSLARVGRESEIDAVPAGTVHAEDARVEIRRPGLVEWFVNGPDGLEQGFTLAERPAGNGELRLELELADAQATQRGEQLIFETRTGRKLSYAKLAAFDAHGTPLAAEFTLAQAGRVALAIDDADARYPIVVDPLLTETADTQLEADQASAELGFAVASAGDVNGDGYADVIVGAPLYDAGLPDEGAAFLFLGSPAGVANGNPASAHVLLRGVRSFARFGASVASAGDVNGDGYGDVIVGAPHYQNGGPSEAFEGAAFVYLGSAIGVTNGFLPHARLESGQGSALLGQSVASAGDVNGDGFADVIAGAPSYDTGQGEGAAFVFLGSANGIPFPFGGPATAHAQLESDLMNAEFGVSVASAGDVNGDGYADVILGAPSYGNVETGEGAAFVFLGSASGVADGSPTNAHAQLESNQTAAALGASVATAGDVNGDGYADVIVGAPGYSSGTPAEGVAFLFLGSASGVADGNPVNAWRRFESNLGLARLGISVASAGDVNGDGYADVIVGADLYDNGQSDEGTALVFLGSATDLPDGNPLTAYARLESGQIGAKLGGSVASAGDVNGDGYADVVVGASSYNNVESDEGAAFVYHGGATGIADGSSATAASEIDGGQSFAELGRSVASAGDVNGDGYGDVIVGAPLYDNGHTNEGAAFVFHGSASGIPDAVADSANTQLEGNQDNANFGYSVASAGDVNGDGYADVIVGAPFWENVSPSEVSEGAAFVFLGTATGVADNHTGNAPMRFESDQAQANLGNSVASAGDVNGDGYADVIVGAPQFDNGHSNEGAAFVFLGSATAIAFRKPADAHAQLESDQANALLGWSVASAGDVNGDGYADVIVGAWTYDAGDGDEGAAFVFQGSASGMVDGNPLNAHAQLESDLPSANLGFSVASAGDVNGDGHADVIVGAPSWANGQASEGAVFVFHGSASGIADGSPASAHAQFESEQASAEFGVSVASAGDVNGDGYADVIVGADTFDNGQTNEGAAFVFLGSASGVVGGGPSAVAQLQGDQGGALSGISVASAGDVNGDGFADVIVGALRYDDGVETDEGAVFVYQGNPNPGNGNVDGRPVLARQKRGDGSGIPVQPWGGSHSGTGFAVELRANHPQGSGRVKVEIEACPLAAPFGDASCTSVMTPLWIDVDAAAPDVAISQILTGLEADPLYRWRARVLHAPATGAIPANPAHGPWRRPGAQSAEADIRLVPEPGSPLSLVSGAALLTLLARRRAARAEPRPTTGCAS
jgi:hypothetical protein